MASRREQILAAITTTLGSAAGIDGRAYRSRMEALSRDEAPALVVEPGQDSAQVTNLCKLDWRLDVVVSISARGEGPDTLADPTIVSVHSLLMADRTIGGLAYDVVPTTVSFDLERADLMSCWTQLVYRVSYRCSVTDLESA
jgi:hypothetical protein